MWQPSWKFIKKEKNGFSVLSKWRVHMVALHYIKDREHKSIFEVFIIHLLLKKRKSEREWGEKVDLGTAACFVM